VRLGVNDQSTKAGLYASAAMHAALLAFLVFGFAFAPKFEDAGESIPVETVSQSQFNQIMKGERDAKPMKEAPPEPPQRQAAADPQPAPTPPTPPPDLKTAETPPPQTDRRGSASAGAAGQAEGNAAAEAKGRSARQDPRQGQGGTDEADQAVIRPQRDRQADRPVEDQRRYDADRRDAAGLARSARRSHVAVARRRARRLADRCLPQLLDAAADLAAGRSLHRRGAGQLQS
jgi:type IV secretory pathway VirB10-like protein